MSADRLAGGDGSDSKSSEPRLGTDEESAARIREAIKSSLARAHGEWVQLEPAAERKGAEPVTETVPSSGDGHSGPDAELPDEPRDIPAPLVGPVLREARDRRGVTLDQAEDDTRISKRYLQALESDSPSDHFPSAAYARFFLRDYGQYLGLDEGDLGDAYKTGEEGEDGEVQPPSLVGRRPGRRWAAAAAAAVVLAAVIVLGVTRIGSSPQENAGPATNQRSPAAAVGAVTPSPSPSALASRPTEVVAVLRVSERSWVQASTDGRTVFQRILPPGSVQRLKAKKTLTLVLGNGGGVQLTVNGKAVPTGSRAKVLHLSFELRDGRVVGG